MDSFLCVGREVLFAGMELGAIWADQVLEVWRALINVADGLEDSILAHVFRGERVAASDLGCQGHRVVHVINILFCPITHVSHESSQVVSVWHCDRAVPVVL